MTYANGRLIHDADSHLMELDDCLDPYFDPRLLAQFHACAGYRGALNRNLRPGRSREAHADPVFRAGIDAIPRTQIDSGRAIGLSPWQVQRFVVLPQAVRIVLPAVAGQFVSLVKDSSLLSVLSIAEFTLAAQEVNSFTYATLETYLPLAVGYLILTLPLAAVSRWLERRLRYEVA